jgi:hypothetical protein
LDYRPAWHGSRLASTGGKNDTEIIEPDFFIAPDFFGAGKKTIIRMAGGVKKYETHREPTSGEVLFAAGPFLDISHIFP